MLIVGLVLCMPDAAFAGNCATSDPFPYESPYDIEECPADIQDWLDRANACAHFAGEEAYDEERAAELDQIMNENQCDYIACDFEDLFAKYEGDIVYTGVITGYGEVLYGEEGVPPCDMEREMPPEERVGDEYLEE